MIVQKVPSYAAYDYMDSFGQRHYHTKSRTYIVSLNGTIISERR